jgi:predicted choloylglycine hydrolase
MDLEFRSVSEAAAGPKWAGLFEAYWPAYRKWYLSEGLEDRPTYLKCRRSLKDHMPELVAVYDRLCELAGGGDLASRFLSMYRPPAYISGCSQVAWAQDEPTLIRNYDYSPRLIDGVLLESCWTGRRVIASTDALWGCLDGINDCGLAISLTFGGRRVAGDGFGAPLILRYVLEVCETARQAGEVLERVPSHMAYNVTVLDRRGDFRTAFLAPDRPARVRPQAIATNHQGEVEWHRHARRTATVERELYLKFRLAEKAMTPARLATHFLRSPLYTDAYRSGFGTLYTALLRPAKGSVEYRWPDGAWTQSFAHFREEVRAVRFFDPHPHRPTAHTA